MSLSNSYQLEQRFESQNYERGTNVLSQSAENWKVTDSLGQKVPATPMPGSSAKGQFSDAWFESNSLANRNNDAGSNSAKRAISVFQPPSGRPQSQVVESLAYRAGDITGTGTVNNNPSRVSDENMQKQFRVLSSNQQLSDRNLASRLSGNNTSNMDAEASIFEPQNQVVLGRILPEKSVTEFPPGSAWRGEEGLSQQPADISQFRPPQQQPRMSGMPRQQPQQPGQDPNADQSQVELYQQRLAVQNNPTYAQVSPSRPESQTMGRRLRESQSQQPGALPPPPSTKSPSGVFGVYGSQGEVLGVEAQSRQMRGSGSAGSDGMGGRMARGGANYMELQMMVTPQIVIQEEFILGFGQTMTTTMATKYTSLDIEIPQTGTVYLFTAPQAENRLSVSGISPASSQRMRDLCTLAVLLTACGLIGFFVVRRKRDRTVTV
jgi:hypothetical protein